MEPRPACVSTRSRTPKDSICVASLLSSLAPAAARRAYDTDPWRPIAVDEVVTLLICNAKINAARTASTTPVAVRLFFSVKTYLRFSVALRTASESNSSVYYFLVVPKGSLKNTPPRYRRSVTLPRTLVLPFPY